MITSTFAGIFGTSKAEVRSVLEECSSSVVTPRRLNGLIGIATVAMAAGLTEQAHASPITWIGGNANWDATNANWNPADEPDSNDEAIFNTPNDVNMANATDTIIGLTLSGGIDLDTNGNDLIVDGIVQLVDASTNLYIGGSTSVLQADSVAINSGGTIRITGGTVTVVEETGSCFLSDGVLSGDFNVLLINQGRLDFGALGTDGQVQGKDFQQTGTGTTHIDLGGVALNAFDRLNLTGASTLSGRWTSRSSVVSSRWRARPSISSLLSAASREPSTQ